MKSDCVFCRIVEGSLPCTKVYEDEDVLAFLDIGPVVKGHTLVIPRAHLDPLTQVPPEVLSRLMQAVQTVAGALVRGLRADGVNVHQANGAAAGQVIPHVHFHVIPRFDGDGHHWNWSSQRYASDAECDGIAVRLRAALP